LFPAVAGTAARQSNRAAKAGMMYTFTVCI
jgi:hypothetical protein